MDRRAFVTGLGAALAASLVAEAQHAGRVWRIGYLSPDVGPGELTEVFLRELRGLGYIEGQNLVVESRWLGERPERLPELATDLVNRRPDVIVAISHRVALAVKTATTTIPIVFGQVNDPVGVGLVASLSHPTGNVTGLSSQGLDLIAKRLELLKALLPGDARVAYLGNPDEPYWPAYIQEAQRAARALVLPDVASAEARRTGDFDAALGLIIARRSTALLVEPNPLNLSQRGRIADFAIAHRLPTMYATRPYVDAGGLASYGLLLPVHHQKLALYVDKILKGAKSGDLPVEQPTKFELVINLKTAKALGLTIPQSVPVRADQVFE